MVPHRRRKTFKGRLYFGLYLIVELTDFEPAVVKSGRGRDKNDTRRKSTPQCLVILCTDVKKIPLIKITIIT